MELALDYPSFDQFSLLEAEESGRLTESYEVHPESLTIQRNVRLRNGKWVSSAVQRRSRHAEDDAHSAFDLSWLQSYKRPEHSTERGQVRLVDLFSGCGGLSLGITEACRALQLGVEYIFAADINPLAQTIYTQNFLGGRFCGEPVQTLVGEINRKLSKEEKRFRDEFGLVDILVAGPPCQGHSDLNNHTRRNDPKNALFETVIRFVQLLEPTHVVIENVPGIRHDKKGVTHVGRLALEAMGYRVSEQVLLASELGAAQRRRRFIMVATRQPEFSFLNLSSVAKERTVRWACGDLLEITDGGAINSHASSSRDNRQRIAYLFEHDLYDLPDEMRPACHRLRKHSYQSVYGRLRWDELAPTITSGFNSPGQGRFIHPEKHRTLTPHEAARLQFFPDFFDWSNANREGLTQMIGNAVPPKLAYAVALELLR